ncbi:MAG: hypothetical protein HKN87_00710 [Saprospiraceae bacterium]|nr:hypothetical protein [Saprospiraceae bacterium]
MDVRSSAKRFFRNVLVDSSLGFQLFSIVRQAATLVVGIILARSTLSLFEIGIYEAWMYLGLFIMLFGVSGVLQALASRFSSISDAERGNVLWNVYLLILCLASIATLGLIAFKDFLESHIFNLAEIPHFTPAVIFLGLHFSASIFPFILLLQNKSTFFLPVSFVYGLSHILAISVPLYLGLGLEMIVQALLFFAIVQHIFIWYLLKGKGFGIMFSFLRPFLVISVPLILYLAIGYLAQIFDSWLVNWHYADIETFAIFRYGARELPGALALAGSFTTAAVVLLSKDLDHGLKRIQRGTRKFLHLFFPIAIVLMMTSPHLFTWVYGPSFSSSAFVFNTYLLLLISRWFFPHAILMAKEDNLVLFLTAVVELILNVGISLALVYRFGLVGIAMGTVMAFFLEKCLLTYLVLRRHKIDFRHYVPIRLLGKYTMVTLVAYTFSLYWFGYSS